MIDKIDLNEAWSLMGILPPNLGEKSHGHGNTSVSAKYQSKFNNIKSIYGRKITLLFIKSIASIMLFGCAQKNTEFSGDNFIATFIDVNTLTSETTRIADELGIDANVLKKNASAAKQDGAIGVIYFQSIRDEEQEDKVIQYCVYTTHTQQDGRRIRRLFKSAPVGYAHIFHNSVTAVPLKDPLTKEEKKTISLHGGDAWMRIKIFEKSSENTTCDDAQPEPH